MRNKGSTVEKSNHLILFCVVLHMRNSETTDVEFYIKCVLIKHFKLSKVTFKIYFY